MIDEALDEIEQTEEQVIALFEELGGPDLAGRLLAYYENAAKTPRINALRIRRSEPEP